MIDHNLADRLGIDHRDSELVAAEYLLRQAGRAALAGTIPLRAANWLVGVGTELNGHDGHGHAEIAKNTAAVMIDKLHRTDAPTVLALMEPDQFVGGCRAKQLGTACKALVRRHLTGFCLRILDTWQRDGTGHGEGEMPLELDELEQ